MAKTLKVSPLGTTFYTLPGKSAALSLNGATLDDTILGQTFSSMQPGLIDWEMSGPALYKGFAGYVATIKKSGTSTAVTGEAMNAVSGQTYEITDTTKNVWDYNSPITIYDNAVDVTAQVESIDHLFGRVTFLGTYTVNGPVTADVNYLPLSSIGTAESFTLTQTANAINNTDLATAQANGGYKVVTSGLRAVSLSTSGFYSTSNGFKTLLQNRGEFIIELNPDGTSKSIARGFFRCTKTGQSGDVGAQETETADFNLSVPDNAAVVTPFKWLHDATTTLSTAVQTVLNAWQNETTVVAEYLPDGVTGWSGTGVVTNVSLTGGVNAMNDFSVTISGAGALTAV